MGRSKNSTNVIHHGKGRSRQEVYMLGAMVFLVLLTLTCAATTQYFARAVGYPAGIGEVLFADSGWVIYVPFECFSWFWKFGGLVAVRDVLQKTQLVFGSGVVLSLALTAIVIVKASKREKPYQELHGSAHWATEDEVMNTGFLGTKHRRVDGVYIGSLYRAKDKKLMTPWHPQYQERFVQRKVIAGSLPKWEYGTVGTAKAGLEWGPKWLRLGWGALHPRQVVLNKEGKPVLDPNPKVWKATEYLRDNDPTHILVYAPTRSGKGVGIVLPTLFGWRHSVVVNDIKGEAWKLTAGFRKAAGQAVIKFEPAAADGDTACWNPIEEIRIWTEHDVEDAQNILKEVIDADGKAFEGSEAHWAVSSWDMLCGIALHLSYRYANRNRRGDSNPGMSPPSLMSIGRWLSDPGWTTPNQMWDEMKRTIHDPEGKMGWVDSAGRPTGTHPYVASSAAKVLAKEEKERSGVISTVNRHLSLFMDPIVGRNTSRCDFKVKDVMNSDKPVSLYHVVEPNDLGRLRPISRIFFSLLLSRNMSDMREEDGRMVGGYKHKMLLLIDELPSLRKLDVLEVGLGYMAGYGIKALLICQDKIQLEREYTKEQMIESGCHVRIAYAPNKYETAESIANSLAKTTINQEKESDSGNLGSMNLGSKSVSHEQSGRELLTAGEVMALSPEDMLLFVAGCAPIYGRKIKYYEIPAFDKASRMKAPIASDRIMTIEGALVALDGEAERLARSAAAAPVDVEAPAVAGGVLDAVAAGVREAVAGDHDEKLTVEESALAETLMARLEQEWQVIELDAFTEADAEMTMPEADLKEALAAVESFARGLAPAA